MRDDHLLIIFKSLIDAENFCRVNMSGIVGIRKSQSLSHLYFMQVRFEYAEINMQKSIINNLENGGIWIYILANR